MNCPKCTTGKLVPYGPEAGSDSHCRICGYYQAGPVAIVMPEIPPKTAPLSTDPHAVRSREFRQQGIASGWRPEDKRPRVGGTPHRKKTAAVNKEAANV